MIPINEEESINGSPEFEEFPGMLEHVKGKSTNFF